MGNICGKTESEPFSQPGRVLGTAPPPNYGTAAVPKKVGGPPRTLGGGAPAEGGSSLAQDDARRKAAEAAEARAKALGKGGKLKSQLDAQKKQNRVDTLKDASNQELRSRDADEAAKARNWD
ncbi:Fc.00g064010.m01.CDS01 [Cosmosporella sp. VM-42]